MSRRTARILEQVAVAVIAGVVVWWITQRRAQLRQRDAAYPHRTAVLGMRG